MEAKPGLAYAPDFPGGTIEKGETNEHALIREIKEELGIDITDAPRKYITQCGSPFLGFSVTMFLVWANIHDVNLSEEHCMFSWVTLEEMRNMPWWGGYRQLFREVEKYLEHINDAEFAEYKKAITYV